MVKSSTSRAGLQQYPGRGRPFKTRIEIGNTGPAIRDRRHTAMGSDRVMRKLTRPPGIGEGTSRDSNLKPPAGVWLGIRVATRPARLPAEHVWRATNMLRVGSGPRSAAAIPCVSLRHTIDGRIVPARARSRYSTPAISSGPRQQSRVTFGRPGRGEAVADITHDNRPAVVKRIAKSWSSPAGMTGWFDDERRCGGRRRCRR